VAKQLKPYDKKMISGPYRSFIQGTGIVLAVLTAMMFYGAYSSGQLLAALKPLSVVGATSAALIFFASKIPKKKQFTEK